MLMMYRMESDSIEDRCESRSGSMASIDFDRSEMMCQRETILKPIDYLSSMSDLIENNEDAFCQKLIDR